MMLFELLQKQTGLSESQLSRIAETASNRYKVYLIPKRGGGERVIAHPSKELKAIQRWLNKTVFNHLPVHMNATAYKKGSGIKANAERHKDSLFTLRLDFRDFFPSFSSVRIRDFLVDLNGDNPRTLSTRDINFICSIVTRNGHLTIGAPSSPQITNAMMFDFDAFATAMATERGLVYTRYADDLFISSSRPNALAEVPQIIRDYAAEYQHVNLTINQKKTTFLSRRYHRSITGLVITPDRKVSIGRKRKREIHSLVNSFKYENLDRDRESYLQGLIAFALDVETEFVEALVNKYGVAVINSILRKREEG